MEASFRNHLVLPRKLGRRFKGNICEIIKLRGPSGETWRIEVHKSENKLSLKSGWRSFVTANKIDKNDLLVFKYRERISSDKEISSRAVCEQKIRVKNGDEASSDVNKKARQGPSDMPYRKSRAKLPVAQQKVADKMAVATQPGSKLFVKILTPSDINHYLIIPRCSANEYIGKTSKSISLLLANRNKVFPGYYNYSESLQFISRGWRDFLRQYNLKAHTLCLFEVKTLEGGIAIIVHVHPRSK
ncbi:B3 domain-containing protein [Rhynchospora pubera]|uniref:B3 domain-containing protein n=1 Tax=Rhynchospora pubera TaxID=906938 RepID=A0AAV8DSA6_9POAL|nr:B3 domain-containing protein [Rhynchospora pubera]